MVIVHLPAYSFKLAKYLLLKIIEIQLVVLAYSEISIFGFEHSFLLCFLLSECMIEQSSHVISQVIYKLA